MISPMKLLLLALPLALFAASGCARKESAGAARAHFAATKAPAWTLQDVNGQPVSSDQFKGKVLVVDFWATWCGPCRVEIPGYIELQKKYGKDGLVVIGISLDEQGPAVVKQFVEKNGVNYPMVMATPAVIEAFGGVEAIPTTFIIDREGMIRERKIGSEATADFEKRLLPYLKPAS
jgi:peroxiredoxin